MPHPLPFPNLQNILAFVDEPPNGRQIDTRVVPRAAGAEGAKPLVNSWPSQAGVVEHARGLAGRGRAASQLGFVTASLKNSPDAAARSGT